MIEAYFTTSSATIIPVLIPDDHIMEVAEMLEMNVRDLFCIDIQGGASRHTSIRCLVSQASIVALYESSGAYGEASATFSWRESSLVIVKTITVTLLPPKPLFTIPEHGGVFAVEAVDVRYWWKRSFPFSLTESPVFGPLFSSDGRWRTGGANSETELVDLLTELRDKLPIGTFSLTGYSPNNILKNRFADYSFTPECSVALAIDIILSLTGYVMLWSTATGGYIVKRIQSDQVLLNGWMVENQRAFAGGTESQSNSFAMSDDLMELWSLVPNAQINRMPNCVNMSYPFRSVEGKTYYNNDPTSAGPNLLKFQQYKEFGTTYDIPTQQPRSTNGCLILKEPRALIAAASIPWDPTVPTTSTLNSPTPPAFDWINYGVYVQDLLVLRCGMTIGTTVWMGWPTLPNGPFRGTTMRFSLGRKSASFTGSKDEGKRSLVPITTTICDDKDWIFGPDGLSVNHPSELVMSKGLAHARRLANGVLQLDVAPPNCRIFPAKITGSQRMENAGNEYWKFFYTFEEVEPNPLDPFYPHFVALGSFKREATTARNMIENPNIYVALGNPANFISVGVSQADYPDAVIDIIPICNGAIVMMCEQFMTTYIGSGSLPYDQQYWFSVPNAVSVVCAV
jgi:hypothetical protein